MGYVLAYDEVRPRPLRALHLFTDYLWLYAVEAALFIVAFPDMGCDRYVYEAPCLEPTNAYFPAVKACQWRGADVEPSCAPNATEGASIFTYVFLLLVVSSIMVPLSSCVARLVDVLVSPGASSAKVEVGGGGDETLKTVDEEAPMGDRVDFVVRETTVALRARRAELQKAVETGAASPKTLARFEVARGFKPKYTVMRPRRGAVEHVARRRRRARRRFRRRRPDIFTRLAVAPFAPVDLLTCFRAILSCFARTVELGLLTADGTRQTEPQGLRPGLDLFEFALLGLPGRLAGVVVFSVVRFDLLHVSPCPERFAPNRSLEACNAPRRRYDLDRGVDKASRYTRPQESIHISPCYY